MKHTIIYLTIMTLCVLLSGCAKKSDYIFHRGSDMAEFRCEAPFQGLTIPVYYHIPMDGNVSEMPVQFVMHGVERNADDYRDAWVEKADQYGFIVITPKFSKSDFSESDYQQGRIIDKDGFFSDKDSLTYVLIDQIFNYFVENSDSKARKYNIYGHSAGAQFVHRYMMYNDTHLVEKAISANAGWYTMPTDTIDFPYGLGASLEQLKLDKKAYYAKNMTILLGDADTVRTSDLRVTPEADMQGLNRLARGRNFFDYCRTDAQKMGVPFNWSLQYVSGSNHSNKKMAPAAADILYGR